jgi:hypothetical protein
VDEQELERQESLHLVPIEIDAQFGRTLDQRGGILGGALPGGMFHVKRDP